MRRFCFGFQTVWQKAALVGLNVLLGLGLIHMPLPNYTHATTIPKLFSPLQVTSADETVTLTWALESEPDAPERFTARATTQLARLPLSNINGYQLPVQQMALQVNTHADAEPLFEITQLQSVAWSATVMPSETPIPTILNDDGTRELRPDLATPTKTELPQLPVIVLRDSLLRGQRVVVLGISPLFVQQGEWRMATQLQVKVAGTRLFSANALNALLRAPVGSSTAHALKHANTSLPNAPNMPLYRVVVANSGMQKITGAMLLAAGINIAEVNVANIHLRYNGKEIALLLRGDEDGVLDAQDALLFYAPSSQDRWNKTSTFWLSFEATPGLRMTTRSAGALTAPLRTIAVERGNWRNNRLYDSTLDGIDGDHWFYKRLSNAANAESGTMIELPATLPLAQGTVSVTVFGSTFSNVAHALEVTSIATDSTETAKAQPPTPAFEQQSASSFNGSGDWSNSFTLSSNDPQINVQLTSAMPDSYQLDSLTYARPVHLSFNKKGGVFWTVDDWWVYALTDLPSDATIYDVTNPLQPLVQQHVSGKFQLGATPKHMVVSDAAANTPAVFGAAWLGKFTLPENVQQLYIAPRLLLDDLAPLLALRQTQGRVTAAVAVEDIYDAFGYGAVSPESIRRFIQFVAGQRTTASLRSVALVGDGNYDPHNFLQKNNPLLIPPYLAEVDPWVGETACDVCYGLLDGDVLSDGLPDVMVGRLPVKSKAELVAVVQKLVAYETAPTGTWNWRSVHIADNYLDENGKPDNAGNFPAFQEEAVQQQPTGVDTQRLYYTPRRNDATQPWQEADALNAHNRVFNLINNGAAIVNFQGHGQVGQLAYTAHTPNSTVNYLLGLEDIPKLTNGTKLPFVIEMACLTGAFHRPLDGAMTIDEALVLAPNGGAIATWGSTGLGLAYQHEFLQKGIYAALWATPNIDATVGDLAHNSLARLFTDAYCCHDALRTYNLLGDPLTTVRAFLPRRFVFPLVYR